MHQILQYLAQDGSFLYARHGFRIVSSEYSDSWGGTGSIVLDDGVLQIRLWLDRTRLCLDMRGAYSKKRGHAAWHSLGIVMELITDSVPEVDRITPATTEFLKDNIQAIKNLFSRMNIESTDSACALLEKKRASQLG